MAIAQSETRFEMLGCGLCGSAGFHPLYTAKDRLSESGELFHIVACKGCGVLRTLPELSDSELAHYYPTDYWSENDEPSLAWLRKSQWEKTRLLSRCRLTGGKILDVGCGAGFFLRALEGADWERYGVETGGPASDSARRSLGRDRIRTCDLVQARFEDDAFDVITFWSALEHMNDPRLNVEEARRIIKRGGSLIVQVPNAASYQARFFRGDWYALDAPRHRYHFDITALDRLLRDNGFSIYFKTVRSKTHNTHSLRQSLKTRLAAGNPGLGFAIFCLAVPFIKPFDHLMTLAGQGATITVAARAE
jgi:SAM-dependent methyltransferase